MPRRPDETPSIGEQISRLNGLLERIASDLAGEMQAIDDEAVVRTTAAIRAANDRRRDVLARLAELEDAQAVLRRHGVSSADEPVETAPYESFAPSVSTHRRERTAGDPFRGDEGRLLDETQAEVARKLARVLNPNSRDTGAEFEDDEYKWSGRLACP